MPPSGRLRPSPPRFHPLSPFNAASTPGHGTKARKWLVSKESNNDELPVVLLKDNPLPPPRREAEDHYLLLIRLDDVEDPCITRTLSIPARFTFAELHDAIQIAFGWTNTYDHLFSIYKQDDKVNMFSFRNSLLFFIPTAASFLPAALAWLTTREL